MSYPVFVRVEKLPRAGIIGAAILAAVVLGYLLGNFLTDAALAFAESIIWLADQIIGFLA